MFFFFFSNDVYNISSCVFFIFYFKSYANSTVRVFQYLYSSYTTLPRIRRERSFHELPSPKDVSPSSKPVEKNVLLFSAFSCFSFRIRLIFTSLSLFFLQFHASPTESFGLLMEPVEIQLHPTFARFVYK